MNPVPRRLTALLLALFTLLATQAAHAGPLLDRLKERRAERQGQTTPDTSGELDTTGPAGAVSLPSGVRRLSNLAYGSDPKQRMDVYLPAQMDPAAKAPVILMVHGGGWRRGDKDARGVVQNKMTRWVPKGFVFVSVNYPLLPQSGPLAQAKDVAVALAKAQALAPSWGADPAKFVLIGHSSGAHLVALLSAGPTLAYQQGAQPWLGTVSLDNATLDVAQTMGSRHFSLYDPAFGTDPAYWRATSPIVALSAASTPLLAVCSSRRSDSCPQAQAYVARATALGVKATELPKNLSHGEINNDLGEPGAYTSAVEDFLGALHPALNALLKP